MTHRHRRALDAELLCIEVCEAGYAGAVISDNGINKPGADFFALRRAGRHYRDGINRFKTKVRLGGPFVPALKRRLKAALGRP